MAKNASLGVRNLFACGFILYNSFLIYLNDMVESLKRNIIDRNAFVFPVHTDVEVREVLKIYNNLINKNGYDECLWGFNPIWRSIRRNAKVAISDIINIADSSFIKLYEVAHVNTSIYPVLIDELYGLLHYIYSIQDSDNAEEIIREVTVLEKQLDLAWKQLISVVEKMDISWVVSH